MEPLTTALRLLRRQSELEEAIRRPGGIRVTEERELFAIRELSRISRRRCAPSPSLPAPGTSLLTRSGPKKSNAGMRVAKARRQPRCVVIAGPNDAGKTTFAREFLERDARVIHFINADHIAAGLSPLAPERAALSAARPMLAEIDRLKAARENFACESTLSGRADVSRLKRLKSFGIHVAVALLGVASARLALRRITARVRQGGHPVRKVDVFRPFKRGWKNFETAYRPLLVAWAMCENLTVTPVFFEQGP